MIANIHRTLFVDEIRKYESCSLSVLEAEALYDYLDDIQDEMRPVVTPISIGDYAILTYSTTIDELNMEHDRGLETFEDVVNEIAWDHLNDTAVAVIDCNSSFVMIGIG